MRRTAAPGALDVIRFALALVLLAWLPGYAWTLLVFPKLERLPRFAYSVALSVSLVTGVLFGATTFLHVPLTTSVVVGASLLLTALPLGWRFARRRVPGAASREPL